MRRFEHKESKFWEIGVQGSEITVRYGRIGANGRTSTKALDSEAAADAEATKRIQQKLAKGYVEVDGTSSEPTPAPAVKKPRAKTKKKAAFPSYPGITDRKLRNLGPRLEKVFDKYKIDAMLLEANGNQWGAQHALLWHLVEHDLIAPEKSCGLLDLLAEEPLQPKPEVVVKLLCRLPDDFTASLGGYNPIDVLQQYPYTVDKLLFANYPRIRSLLPPVEEALPPNIQRGLAFVRGRHEEPVHEDVAHEILDQLAEGQTRSHGIAGNPMPFVENGELVDDRDDRVAQLGAVATRFGTRDAWLQRLVHHAQRGIWMELDAVRDALLAGTTEEVARMLVGPSFSGNERLGQLLSLLASRGDDGQALLDGAQRLLDLDQHGTPAIREMFALLAAAAFAREGRPVPEELDPHITFQFISDVTYASLPVALAGLRAMPRERVLALARAAESYHSGQAMLCVAAHWDEDLFSALLEKGRIGFRYLGACGPRILPTLEAMMPEASAERAVSLHMAILEALATGEEEPDARWDRWITYAHEGGQPIRIYRPQHADVRARVLARLPIARRNAVVLGAIAHPDVDAARPFMHAHLLDDGGVDEAVKQVVLAKSRASASELRRGLEELGDRAMEPLLRHVSGASSGFMSSLKQVLSQADYKKVKAARSTPVESECQELQRLVAEVGGETTRVYLLHTHQRARKGYPLATGRSRCGGEPVGIPSDALPRDADGTLWDHLFTLDLAELPELQARYDGADALAVFCPQARSGERTDETVLLPIPELEKAGRGTPIAVFGVDIPRAVFAPNPGAQEAALRRIVFDAAGFVGGQPLWIQEEAGDTEGWVMQLHEELGDVNLGDSGSLYVYDGWAVAQSH